MNDYTNGVLYNTGYETYGAALKVNKVAITGFYSLLAVAIPFFVPIWLAPYIYKKLPNRIRYEVKP